MADEDHGGGLRVAWLEDRRAGGRSPDGGDRVPALRPQGREGRRPVPPRAGREQLRRHVRGRGHQPRAPVQGHGIGVHPDRAREVHGPEAMPHLSRPAPAPGGAGGECRWAQHLRGGRAVRHRGAGLGGRAVGPGDRARADDRPPGAQGDRGAARVPGGRRAGLPDARSGEHQPVGRRGPADPAGDADRHDAHGRPVHPRRAVDRAPPARQRQADRHADTAAGPGQHRARGGARRGDDPDRGLGHRHRAGGGRARRRDHRERSAGGGPRGAALDHRRVPARRALRGGPGAAPGRQREAALGPRRPRAQPARRGRAVPARARSSP